MIRVNLISPRRLPFHNFPGYLLSDIAQGEPRALCFKNVTSTYLYKTWHPDVVSSTASVPRGPLNPLRLVTARFPRYEVSWFDSTERLAWYVDTLECGHQITVFRDELTATMKRHRCAECAKALSQKKPVRPVNPKAKDGAA